MVEDQAFARVVLSDRTPKAGRKTKITSRTRRLRLTILSALRRQLLLGC